MRRGVGGEADKGHLRPSLGSPPPLDPFPLDSSGRAMGEGAMGGGGVKGAKG